MRVPAKSKFSLDEILYHASVLMKHWRVMTLLFTLVLTSGLVYFAFCRPVYYSKALVEVQNLNYPGVQDYLFSEGGLNFLITQWDSPHIRERTATALGRKMGFVPNRELIRGVRIGWESPRILHFRVYGYDPKVTQEWAKTVIHESIDYRVEQRQAYRDFVVEKFEEDRAMVGEKHKESELKSAEFDAQYDVQTLKLQVEELKNLPVRKTILDRRIAEMERVSQFLDDDSLEVIDKLSKLAAYERESLQLGDELAVDGRDEQPKNGAEDGAKPNKQTIIINPPTAPPPVAAWSKLSEDRVAIENEIADLAKIFLPGHRKMKEAAARLEAVDKDLQNTLDHAQKIFELDYANALEEREHLESLALQLYEKQLVYNDLELQKAAIESNKQAWMYIYGRLGKQMSDFDYAIDRERVDFEYLGLIEFSGRSIVPNKGKLLIYSVVFGLGLAIGVAYLIEFLDNSVTRLEKIQDDLAIRPLGLIPALDTEPDAYSGSFTLDKQTGRKMSDNFREIRTNIQLGTVNGEKPKVILVTSSIPREGKTFVAASLAHSFAQLGERTLLIDGDLRRGKLKKVFGVNGEVSGGLQDILGKDLSIDDCVFNAPQENLDVLFSGKYKAESIENFGNRIFADLIDELRPRYDKIIIDSPPVLGLPETSMMQPVIDGTVFIVWAGKTPLVSIKASVEQLRNNHANMLGFVLNRLDLSAATHYSNYYYYSYDYYNSYRQSQPVLE